MESLSHHCVRTLDRALAVDITVDIAPNRALARALAVELARSHDRALDLALNSDPPRARALNRALNRALYNALNYADVVDRALVRPNARLRNRAPIAAELKDYRRAVLEIIEELERAKLIVQEPRSWSTGSSNVEQRAPWGVAIRVIGWLVQTLPATEWSRYREEHRAELFDLAQTKHPRRAQLIYTARSLTGVVSLRRALRLPAPQPRRQIW